MLRDLYASLEKEGVLRIVFYGAGDLAEIAYLSLQEFSIELVAVVDDGLVGKRFMQFTVGHTNRIDSIWFDRILITSNDPVNPVLEKITKMGIAAGHVVALG